MIGTTGSRIEGGEDAIVPIVRTKTTEICWGCRSEEVCRA